MWKRKKFVSLQGFLLLEGGRSSSTALRTIGHKVKAAAAWSVDSSFGERISYTFCRAFPMVLKACALVPALEPIQFATYLIAHVSDKNSKYWDE